MSKKIPKSAITEATLRKKLTEAMGPDGTGTNWAKENGITPQQVSAFDRKVQGPGLKIPGVLGYKPQVIYIPVDEPDIYSKPPPRGKAGPTKDEVMAEKAKAKKKAMKVNKEMSKAEKKPKKDKKKKRNKK